MGTIETLQENKIVCHVYCLQALGARNLGNYVLPISKCPAQQSTSQVSYSLGKVTDLRQDEHISYSWMFLCHKRTAHFRTEFSRSPSWQLTKVNRRRHFFEQEVLNETRLDISDTKEIFFLTYNNSKHIKSIIPWPQEGRMKT